MLWQERISDRKDNKLYIEKINITSFGRLNNFELELHPGMNIIEGANESGKSTVAAFIKFMFYGLSPKEKPIYLGWDSSVIAGTLTFCANNKRYRIERAIKCSGSDNKPTFREAVQLVDLSDNTPCHKGESPGMLFFGVDADMFFATAFISQLGGTAIKGAKVSEGIENLLFSADENVNTQRALDKLDSARVSLLHKNSKGGKIFELSNEIAELEAMLDKSLKNSAEIRAKEAKLSDMREKEESDRKKSEVLNRKLANFEAHTVAELFDRMHLLEKKTSQLKEEIENNHSDKIDKINSLREISARIDQLKLQLDSLCVTNEYVKDSTLDQKLEKFNAHGGRNGIEDEMSDLRSSAKSHIGVGAAVAFVAFLAFGFAALSGILNIFDIEKKFAVIGLTVGIILLAFSFILFRSAAKSKRELKKLQEDFDIDKLEEEENRRSEADDAARTAEILRKSVQNQLDDTLELLRNEYGIEPNELSDKLAELDYLNRTAIQQKSEYDKNKALLIQMRSQLEQYDENEIRSRLGSDFDGIDTSNLSAVKREAEFLTNSAKTLEKFSIQLEREIAQMPNTEHPSKIEDRLNAAKLELAKLEKELAALKLAQEKLHEASDDLRSSVAPRLAKDAGELLGVVTSKKYSEVGVGSEMSLTCRTEAGQKSIELLSAGTQDAAYLALRISLCKLIYRKNIPPMIFDESFGRMDDERCRAMLKLAAECEQSLVMTASTREKNLAGEYNYIKI